jgi:hypothetical protein
MPECARCREEYPRDELYKLILDDTQGFHNWVESWSVLVVGV